MSTTRFKTINTTKRTTKRIKSGNKFSKSKNNILPSKITIIKSKNDNKNKFNLKRGINKKNFSNNLLRRCQMKYNSFIKKHKDAIMYGTKRYENKSGSYYLKNLSKDHLNQKSITSLRLNTNNQNPKNNDHIYVNRNKDIIKGKAKKTPKELNPILTEKQRTKIKEDNEKKYAFNTIGNTKLSRRYQYSNNITQKQIKQYKEMKKKNKIFLEKIKFIQIWWKTIYQVIKIQKYIRGYLFRIKLISSLEEKEGYIDKVLCMSKIIKKIFFYRFYKILAAYKPGKKYYFFKWNEASSKKLILKNIYRIYSSKKNEENYFFTARITADNKFTEENDDIDSENEFYKIRQEVSREENINKSLMGIYENRIKNKKIKKKQKKSSSSYALRTKKKDINIGIKVSSSQTLKRIEKKINDLSQNDSENKEKAFINNNIINEYDNVKKSENKRNKNNNNQQQFNNKNKFNTYNKNLLKERTLKVKFSKDLKSKKCKNNTNSINISKKNIALNKNNTYLIKSSNSTLAKNLVVKKKRKKDFPKKNSKNIKRVHNYSISNITNHSDILFNKSKNKKIKIYENELTNYNKNINSEKKNIDENQFLSIDKEQLEKLLPYTERIFDISQFSALLDSTILNNNKNSYNNDDDDKQVASNLKNMRINSNIDTESIILLENTNKKNNNNENDESEGLLLNQNSKRLFSGGSILIKIIFDKYLKKFISNFRHIYKLLILEEVIEFFEKYKIKIIIKKLRLFGNNYLLLKYFRYYRSIVDKNIIIQNIIHYEKYLGLKNKDNKKSKESLLLCSDYDIGNKYQNTDFPINNNINNIFNINNNSNNCYIINNLNYNNYNNEINIGLNNKTNSNNNPIPSKNNKNEFGVIRSKIIEFPKNLCKKHETISPISGYDYWNNNIANLNTIDNSNLFRNNTQRNIRKKNSDIIDISKRSISNQVILCKSISLSNKMYLKPDLITQKNQLLMVINIIENHKKFQKKNLFLIYFKKWKNQINNIHNNNINSDNDIKQNIKIMNIKMPKNQNIFNNNENDKNINSYGSIDNKKIAKNAIDSEDFRSESNSKNENKILTKYKLIQNNQLNLDQNKYYTSSTYNYQENKFSNDNFINKSLKGVYKKKTIYGSTNKSMSFFKKNNFNNISQNNYLFQLTNANPFDNTYNNNILNSINTKESDIEFNKNVCKTETKSDKNLDLFIQNNNTEMNGINLRYTLPEKYFGFKKVNKIEEMEVSFFPLNKNKILIRNNDIDSEDTENGNININNQNINNETNYELNDIDKKKVIIEAIEEYNEYENIIQRLKKEFENFEEKVFYKTCDNINKNYNIDINKEQKENKTNRSMINFS